MELLKINVCSMPQLDTLSLMNFIDSFLTMVDKSGIKDMNSRALSITPVVNRLEEAKDTLQKLHHKTKDHEAIAAQRRVVIELYRQTVAHLNALIKLEPTDKIRTFVLSLNNLIDTYKKALMNTF